MRKTAQDLPKLVHHFGGIGSGLAALWILASTLTACGSKPGPGPAPQTQADAKVPFTDRLQRLDPQGRANWLIRELSQDALHTRPARGPWPSFRSQCDFKLDLTPPPERKIPSRKERQSGRRYAPAIHQQTHSTLLWSALPRSPLAFSLERSIESGQTERFFQKGHTLWVQKDREPWNQRPVDDEFLLSWLNEHRRCVGELLALAGPALTLTPSPTGPGQPLSFQLGLSQAPVPTASAPSTHPRRGWRKDAILLSLSGTLRLDPQTGQWLSATVDMSFRAKAPKIAPFEGRAHLEAKATPLPPTSLPWPVLGEVTPMPSPPRYSREAQELLEGLARPAG